MKLKIFKGFNKDFLSKLDCEPLYESPIEMKFNIFKLDDIYKDELEENLILKKNSEIIFYNLSSIKKYLYICKF